jgi:hypothetical protein
MLDAFRSTPEDFSKFVEGAEKSALSPNGWYLTVPPLTVKESDDQKSARFYGECTLQAVDASYLTQNPDAGSEVGGKTRLGFGLTTDDPTSFGARLLAAAYRAFTKAYGKRPESPDEVVEYLKNFPVRLRAVQGKANEEKGFPASMMVVDIRATE